MNQILNESEYQYDLIICGSGSSKALTALVDKKTGEISLEGRMNRSKIVGRVSSKNANQFKSDCIHLGGLPTKEIPLRFEKHEYVELESLVSYYEKAIIPIGLNDILILPEDPLENILSAKLKGD